MKTKIFRSLAGIAVAGALLFMTSCKPNDAQISKAANDSATAIAPNVSVAVENGVATISGTVPDDATKNSVENAVKGVKGVTSITDNVTVPPPAPMPEVSPDMVVKNTIDSSLQANNLSGITVSVNNGEVTLTGNVKRSDLTKVMQIAQESHPSKVNNQLTIK